MRCGTRSLTVLKNTPKNSKYVKNTQNTPKYAYNVSVYSSLHVQYSVSASVCVSVWYFIDNGKSRMLSCAVTLTLP